jgi:hypothetical protein
VRVPLSRPSPQVRDLAFVSRCRLACTSTRKESSRGKESTDLPPPPQSFTSSCRRHTNHYLPWFAESQQQIFVSGAGEILLCLHCLSFLAQFTSAVTTLFVTRISRAFFAFWFSLFSHRAITWRKLRRSTAPSSTELRGQSHAFPLTWSVSSLSCNIVLQECRQAGRALLASNPNHKILPPCLRPQKKLRPCQPTRLAVPHSISRNKLRLGILCDLTARTRTTRR